MVPTDELSINIKCSLSQHHLMHLYLFELLITFLGPNTVLFLTGYILATLPIEEVKRATNSQYILEAIGQLSLPELLVATKEIKPYNYARLLLEKHASINFCIHYIKL
jgi:hypothetical protein